MRAAEELGSAESARVSLEPVSATDDKTFLTMAARYFEELNPDFVPEKDWERYYWNSILKNPGVSLRWAVVDGRRAGFILFGIEEHRFLPRRVGVIYELYVSPRFRHRGIARTCAQQAIRELQSHAASRVQLEIVGSNLGAKELWRSLGFALVAERWVLGKTRA